MPSYGEKHKPACVKLQCGCKPLATRVMGSNNSTITTILQSIDNIPYKHKTVLTANR